MRLYLAIDDTSVGYRAGYYAGRLFYLAVIPVFAIALIYWLSGRSRPQPMPFSHAISRWWVWVAGLLTGFALLTTAGFAVAAPAAQRQAALESSTKTRPAPSVPAGWTLRTDTTDGFEFALPAAWPHARTDPRYFEADLVQVGAAHPDVSQVMRKVKDALGDKGVKLVAADPSQPSGYYTTAIVTVYDAGVGASLDTEATNFISGLEQSSGVVKPVTRSKVTVPVGPAVRVEDRVVVQGFTGTQVSHLMLRGKQGRSYVVVLSFTFAADQLAATQSLIQQAVDSFRYLD